MLRCLCCAAAWCQRWPPDRRPVVSVARAFKGMPAIAHGRVTWCAWQAFYLARTGRPGPVLVDMPKDVQQQLAVPDWDVPMAIAGYMCARPRVLPRTCLWQLPRLGVFHHGGREIATRRLSHLRSNTGRAHADPQASRCASMATARGRRLVRAQASSAACVGAGAAPAGAAWAPSGFEHVAFQPGCVRVGGPLPPSQIIATSATGRACRPRRRRSSWRRCWTRCTAPSGRCCTWAAAAWTPRRSCASWSRAPACPSRRRSWAWARSRRPTRCRCRRAPRARALQVL